MTAPTQVYPRTSEQRGRRGAAHLEALGDRRLPDATATDARRAELTELAREFAAGLSSLERLYVASFLEHDALWEWSGQELGRI